MEDNVTHNSQTHHFETVVDGHTAYIEYVPFDGGIKITHTIVPSAIEGRGVAAKLTKVALKFARSANIKVVPVCPYTASYFKRHPEDNDLLS